MSNRAKNIGLPEQLDQYSQGAAQSAAQPVADFLAPTVEVGSPTGQFKKYNERHRFLVPDTARGVGGRATELSWDAEDKYYNCSPHAIDVPVDLMIEAEADPHAFEEAADLAAEVGSLSHEKRVIEAALGVLGAGENIDTSAASLDLVDTLDKAALSVLKAARYGSLMGVGVLMGANAARLVKNHKSTLGRYNGGGNRKGGGAAPNLEEFSDLLLGRPDVRASFMVYEAGTGAADDVEFLLDNSIIVFARHANPTRRDPSFMKTFRQRNWWMRPNKYTRDDKRVEVAGFDWSADVQISNTVAGVRLNLTNG